MNEIPTLNNLHYHDLRRWFEDATKAPQDADHELLIAGLRKGDSPQCEIGVIDAKVAHGDCAVPDSSTEERKDVILKASTDGVPIIGLLFKKPEERRDPNELPHSWRMFDPLSVFTLRLHLLYGGRLSLEPLGGGNI